MEIIENKRFDGERALYAKSGLRIANCRFEGQNGEFALMECRDIYLDNCYSDLRSSFWHCNGITLHNCTAGENCRAPLWHSNGVIIEGCAINGAKAVRECRNISIADSRIISPEFCWLGHGIQISNTTIDSKYALFQSDDISADGLTVTGEQALQHISNADITNSRIDAKEALWHAKNVTVKDSLLAGGRLGWYSEGLTLINCHISGTQPLCYCKNLTLINCTTEGCNLAFEYSTVKAEIKGGIQSVKNPTGGEIRTDAIGELVMTDDSVYPTNAKVYVGGKILWPGILLFRR